MLLKTPKDTCAECAMKHGWNEPHNQQSFAYQYDFYGKHGRWPTWEDAMAHCTPDVQERWRTELAKVGVILPRTIDVQASEPKRHKALPGINDEYLNP
jgi:hypothetical protein